MTHTSLFKLVSAPTDAPSAINWTKAIALGFPRAAFTTVAAELNMTDKQLSQATGLAVPKKKQEVLDSETSESVYRIDAIRSHLAAQQGWDPENIKAWLSTANPLLRQRVPFDLLKSCMGFDYVVTAAARA